MQDHHKYPSTYTPTEDPYSPQQVIEKDVLDIEMGFNRLTDGNKLGWLINMHEV